VNTAVERGLENVGAPPELAEDTLDLVRYWRAISQKKWRIILLLAAVGILAEMYASTLPPIYRATTTLLIESNKPKIVSIEEVYGMTAAGNLQYYQTQSEILKSRELAARLVKRLRLTEHPAYDPRRQPPAFWENWLPERFVGDGSPSVSEPFDRAEKNVTRAVQSGLGVQLMRNSQLVRISFDSTDQGLAALVPNTLADIFVEADLEARMQMTQKAMSFINSQVGDLRRKLADSEAALQSFRERERILDTKGLAQSGATQQFEVLSRSLLEARTRRTDAELVYNQISGAIKGASPASLETLPAIQKHPLVNTLKAAEAEAEKRLAEASRRYGPEHPRMVAAETDLKSVKENFRKQVASIAQTATREYESARAQEATLERAVASAKNEIQSLNRKEFQLAALERDVVTNRQLYELFIQRFKETNISNEIQSAIGRVVDPAVAPQSAAGPNKRMIVMLSMLAALLSALAFALLGEKLDNTIQTSQDVEAKLGVPVLGVVQITKKSRGHNLEREFLDDPQTVFSESFRTIRSGVMLSGLDSAKKIVVVTSSVPEEGKTTVAANLALALGQIRKTLLIDADMRRPKIGRALGGEGALLGLSELCAGEAKLQDCIYPITNTQVQVVPAGKIPPNPQELLSSQRFADTLHMLSERFEIVVIDSPPVQLVSDALVLSSLATAVVYVVKADATPYPVTRQGMKKLRRIGAPVIGAVLNQLDIVKADRYYGEYSGYGRRYYGRGKYGYGYTGKK
jgi:capsular exopolysaccharide synthesis family protein